MPVPLEPHTITVLVLRPDAPQLNESEAAALQDAHLAYRASLVAAGHIVANGPLVDADDEQMRGFSVWTTDAETARRLSEEDPSVRIGRLAVQVATWLVPAGQLRFAAVAVPASVTEVGEIG